MANRMILNETAHGLVALAVGALTDVNETPWLSARR